MVIDLTRDSSSEDDPRYGVEPEIRTPPLDEGLTLLQKFTRPSLRPGSSSSGGTTRNEWKSTASTNGTVSSTLNGVLPSNKPPQPSFAVVVPSLGCDTGIKRRRLSSEDDSSSQANGVDPEFPNHHGLSSFYSVERSSKALTYQPKQEVSRNRANIQIKQPAVRYHPFQKGHSDKDILSLYLKKLQRIQGPPVTLKIDPSDASNIDFNFEFINEYKLQKGVKRVDPGFHVGCQCVGVCDSSSCYHLDRLPNEDEDEDEDSEHQIIPYQVGRDGKVVLRHEFFRKRAMIYECSPLCTCLPSCLNRVVQKGRTVKLEIFRTDNRGFGLRSPENIQAGQYIDRYLGEVITRKEADAREAATPKNSASYLFQLDFFISAEENCYIVDGRKYGSITRFMNHSCRPNCRMFPVSQYEAERNIFDMAFFAIKNIPAGTELTFDYCPYSDKEGSKAVDPDAVKCLCGERTCRGQLWPNQRKTM
ncbi:uncharacterized protein PADG_02881 [Paracoccidioides brasiliensis Pb18]|uniref:Histone-lysine N-methyltransferase n=2 Tax=Paracoccidioides brasiliensis TaxID=121759 RepID=C1G6S6_PARBD|nr:uncharacterized protein PADG_02881 [Paracoccidioides brasiliensis Pb18]EEH46783.2 hypothetical protein PADG_02881 [Paracoccidioides brasiliensis Pb18]ODH48363.1 hypothetical protein GX48_05565 [Paracoccidioides brasiliensis]